MLLQTRSMMFWIPATLALAVGFAGTTGSLASCAECRCGLSGMAVDVPAERAADVEQVTVSGPCNATVGSCGTTNCTTYQIMPAQIGACHIRVTFVSGAAPVETDVQFQQTSGCCQGIYPANGSLRFTVPALNSGDASADGE